MKKSVKMIMSKKISIEPGYNGYGLSSKFEIRHNSKKGHEYDIYHIKCPDKHCRDYYPVEKAHRLVRE